MSDSNSISAPLARRRWLAQVAVGGAGFAVGVQPVTAAAQCVNQGEAEISPVNFEVPEGACDTHVHVFPDSARFPFWKERIYTPPLATSGQLLDMQTSLGLDRVVIVQPSVYGTDNSPTLHGIRMLGLHRARGVAVLAPDTTRAQIQALYQSGIRGIRVNLEAGGVNDPAIAANKLNAAVKAIEGTGMHLQIYAGLPLITALQENFKRLPVPAVFDHFAGARGDAGVRQPGFNAVIDLVRQGAVYVKVSAPYRSSSQTPTYEEMKPFAQALIQANPERVLWGTDWPHPGKPGLVAATEITTPYVVDNGRMLNLFAQWVPDTSIRKKVLVDNPAKLFGFGQA